MSAIYFAYENPDETVMPQIGDYRRRYWKPVRRYWICVLAGVLGLLPACSGETVPTVRPEAERTGGISDELDDLKLLDPDGIDLSDEFAAFCDLIRNEADTEVPSVAEVLGVYRSALAKAPLEIRSELAALLDYLEFGTEPDFGEQPPRQDYIPQEESSEDPATEPTDPYVFVSADAEQLALSVAAFLDLHCRGVSINPLPPPTVPAALTTD
jgi:hypothetical protein